MNQGTNLGSQVGRWIVLAALVALLGALLLTIRPVGAQDAPPSVSIAETQFTYAENGTGPITTYRANDPESLKIFWTLGGADAADFTIDGGVLRFKSPPNFEVPTDRANDEDGSGGALAAEDEGLANNVYKITVRIGAGGEDGAPEADDYDGDDLEDIDLTVIVDNVNEPGKVVISPRQPQVGTELTAILTDEDNVRPGVGVWQWARSNSMNGPWEDIPNLSDEMTYSPTIDDRNMYLQVRVRYVDRAGSESRNVDAVSEFPVREDTNTSNDRPKFPDQSTLIGVAQPTVALPTQGRTTTDRFIPETAAAGTNVGAPVTAFDDDTDIEVITYSLRDAADGDNVDDNSDIEEDDADADTPAESDGHALSFDIHEVTGQITVSDKAVLDADATGATNPYTVVVRAVDGDGDTQDITVTIHVLEYEEPPIIDRVYVTGRVPTGFTAGNRVPTEFSHYEVDRTARDATMLDANLDTDTILTGEAAIYTASDPDGDTIKWDLEGFDADSLSIAPDTPSAGMATLSIGAPDFEEPGDTDEGNVYEVTIVVTDGTYDMEGQLHRDELDVTVKVLNSTDDNVPGMVSFSNRQPEVATAFTATFADTNGPISGTVEWQWYRSSDNNILGVCPNRTPADGPADAADAVNDRRYFVENDTISGWEEIDTDDARTATYTPKTVYEEDKTTIIADESDNGRCLRATVTYRDDDDVDRTHSAADVQGTDVDETLEATWAATEQPVKAKDESNDAPVFREGGTRAGAPQSTYRRDVEENNSATITELSPAVDVTSWDHDGDNQTEEEVLEDDTVNDLLTYEILLGLDAGSFSITGTILDGTPDNAGDDGVLTFSGGDYESKTEYRVKVRATDPSGDSDTATVIINITPENEGPGWVATSGEKVYWENGTDDVFTYDADDPEGSGITYSLVNDATGIADVEPADIADVDLFEIHSLDGNLSFKESPNFEDPQDAAGGVDADNVYHVAVRAESEDDKDPRDAIYQTVTITVINVHEAPMFSETTDDLEISENPDDPEKEPPSAAKELYLLNRGAGIPSPANPPEAPNLDLGIPVVAVDDDNTFTATDYTGDGIGRNLDQPYSDTNRPVQLIDGLTYELSGPGSGPFHIVPATGQILTMEKLDYETQKEYNVTVKATDPWGLYGMIDLTIEVTDVDEQPVPRTLAITGESSHDYLEDRTDAVGEYTVTAYGGAVANPTWTLKGADTSSFMLDGTGMSRMLKFRSAPDYEAMADADSDNTYEVILTVADLSDAAIFGNLGVTITVTNVDEVGSLSGPASASVMESATDLGTYTLTGGDGSSVTWSLDGADASQFMLDGTGMSRMLKFSSAPDYEAPADADGDNMYMVTVKAEAGGEMKMVEVTITVDNADELRTLSGPGGASISEGMDAVGTYMVSGTMADMAMWTLEGSDRDQFMLDGTGMSRMLKFSSAPDYEMPRGQAMSGTNTNTYMVTVKAEAGGEMEMMEVTVEVTNVEEDGTVTLSSESPVVGSAVTATLTDSDGGITDVSWTWETSSDQATWSAATGTVTSEGTTSTYTSVDDDVDDYLRATASYTDGYDSGNSMRSGSAKVVASNVAPAFPSATATRSIARIRRPIPISAPRSRPPTPMAIPCPTPWEGRTRPRSVSSGARASCVPRRPWTSRPRVPTASKSRLPIRVGCPTPLT